MASSGKVDLISFEEGWNDEIKVKVRDLSVLHTAMYPSYVMVRVRPIIMMSAASSTHEISKIIMIF
jgi:hypothetical protein